MDAGDLSCEVMAELIHDIHMVNELVGNITCEAQGIICDRLAGLVTA